MARKKFSIASTPSRFSIGNCQALVQGPANSFTCDSTPDSLKITASRRTRIEISVQQDMDKNGSKDAAVGKNKAHSSQVDCQFVLMNPRDAESCTQCLQQVLSMYNEELPTMKYAANTGKKSTFLERCVSNRKYCTLILRLQPVDGPREVIAAITYQIIAADTQYAEIPLAAVRSRFQKKGIGQLVYTELRRRFQNVGISTILCWGDKESERFWHKQNFTSIAEVNSKGRVRRLPIKADIRRALCFPGGSILMISHLSKNNDILSTATKLVLPLISNEKVIPSMDKNHDVAGLEEIVESAGAVVSKDQASTVEINGKRTFWEASVSLLKSKRVKASLESEARDVVQCGGSPLYSKRESLLQVVHPAKSIMDCYLPDIYKACSPGDPFAIDAVPNKSQADERSFIIMLMDISDVSKKAYLTKVIKDLGGAVTDDGSSSTHLLSGKVRRTLNFCTALCSGAWILSPSWLKESFREGRFVGVMPYILQDEDYQTKFKVDLKEAVLRARANPGALLKGYKICVTQHIQPPVETITAIVESAGGTVVLGLENVGENYKTIFVACEEDMEEALLAVRRGVRTFSVDWFMNCIMKQELDLDAHQFVVSL